jgi:protein-tyrosine phosphatase
VRPTDLPDRRDRDDSTYRVCFVCTGNICRSPMAEMVLAQWAEEADLALSVDSAGTGPWHEGEPMDPRARRALERAGFADRGHVAQQFDVRRFATLDLVVALDRRHRQTLLSLAADRAIEERVTLLRGYDPGAGGAVDVPDPYYGDDADFDQCLTLVLAGCRGLFQQLMAIGSPIAPDVPRTVS